LHSGHPYLSLSYVLPINTEGERTKRGRKKKDGGQTERKEKKRGETKE